MDAFEELGLGRDLRVSEEVLRRCYEQGSLERHPDKGGTREEFARLREAYEILRSPARRLRHLLELEGAVAPRVGMVPEELMGLFGEVGDLLQRVDGVKGKKDVARTALVRSMAEREAMDLAERVEGMRSRVAGRRGETEAGFGKYQELGVAACREEAMVAATALTFLEKWEAQLQEAWVGLAM